MQSLGISNYSLCPLRRYTPQSNLIQSLGILSLQNRSQSLNNYLLVTHQLMP